MTSDGTWTYTWEHGRELASMTSGGTTWTFTYDANGMRTQRTNGTSTYTYVYNGSQLTYMTVDGNTLRIAYDANSPMFVKYNGTTYQYVTNLQGDVIALLDADGTAVVEYTYDAWGNILSIGGTLANTLGVHNPLRYRGYVYDTEIGLYYLQSRYYDPELGRFINDDSLVATGQGLLGNNMFAYCNNNPISNVDYTGRLPHYAYGFDENGSMTNTLTQYLGLACGAALIAGAVIVSNNSSNQRNKGKSANLPAKKKVSLDMEHISSGHMPDGDRNRDGKKTVFWGLSLPQIEKAIMEAYSNATKLQTQGDRILLTGYSWTYELTIEMWINLVTLIIETAYPK